MAQRKEGPSRVGLSFTTAEKNTMRRIMKAAHRRARGSRRKRRK